MKRWIIAAVITVAVSTAIISVYIAFGKISEMVNKEVNVSLKDGEDVVTEESVETEASVIGEQSDSTVEDNGVAEIPSKWNNLTKEEQYDMALEYFVTNPSKHVGDSVSLVGTMYMELIEEKKEDYWNTYIEKENEYIKHYEKIDKKDTSEGSMEELLHSFEIRSKEELSSIFESVGYTVCVGFGDTVFILDGYEYDEKGRLVYPDDYYTLKIKIRPYGRDSKETEGIDSVEIPISGQFSWNTAQGGLYRVTGNIVKDLSNDGWSHQYAIQLGSMEPIYE
jgi:hypothetical protein